MPFIGLIQYCATETELKLAGAGILVWHNAADLLRHLDQVFAGVSSHC